ncbi:MAG: hypothetical protein JNL28_03720 [Planctomycetes bacterium]|nr:hypothetical protein [Planctomycetota bacterium]
MHRSSHISGWIPLTALTWAALCALAPAQVTCNAPVAPDTIYVGRNGPEPGLSVIDLNGFGGGTGNPTYDPTFQTQAEGWSNYVYNPNVRLQGALLGLPLPTSTLNGGSAGVFTLTRNSALDNLLSRASPIGNVGDMMIGHPIDLVANNGPAPFGCQVGGGNLCATNGLHVVDVTTGGPNTLRPTPAGGFTLNSVQGGGNPISFAPSPNPPPILMGTPALCVSPDLRAREPISVDAALIGLTNLLVPGDPFGNPASGIPPSGLLTSEQNAFFVGPSAPQSSISACSAHQMRQGIGHFLYAIDRTHAQVLVFNSNTFAVIAQIAMPDPTEFAMGPNLDLLAVTNRAVDTVTFVDIDPRSATFHQIVMTTPVEHHPVGVAWDPGNEDVLVCNEGSDSVSIIAAATLAVRKVVRRGLVEPFALAITQRQNGFGWNRNVYYAYILDRRGKVTLFESGPAGVNGWGFDDCIGQTAYTFREPKAIQPDPLRLAGGVWIAHSGQLDPNGVPTSLTGGAATNLVLDSNVFGTVPLTIPFVPNMRGHSFRIQRSIGSDQLGGAPLDIAFDDLRNLGALPNVASMFGSGAPADINGKSQVRQVGGVFKPTNASTYMFLPVRDAVGIERGIDVIDLASGLRIDTNAFHPGVQPVAARSAAVVAHYFRQ